MLQHHAVSGGRAPCHGPPATAPHTPVHISITPSNRRQWQPHARPSQIQPRAQPLIKICGVTNAEDATVAAAAGANFIGMIMWPKAKRAVSDATARQVADIAKAHGAQPVGVFVDEPPEVIVQRCQAAGIPIAQLHGDGSRAAAEALKESGLQVIYVMHATPDGRLVTPLPPPNLCDWLLVDGLQGGSGQVMDWTSLQPPRGAARNGWLLAGGLKPDTVQTAIRLARPTGVDVSSGVCSKDGLRKDARKVEAFIAGAQVAVQSVPEVF